VLWRCIYVQHDPAVCAVSVPSLPWQCYRRSVVVIKMVQIQVRREKRVQSSMLCSCLLSWMRLIKSAAKVPSGIRNYLRNSLIRVSLRENSQLWRLVHTCKVSTTFLFIYAGTSWIYIVSRWQTISSMHTTIARWITSVRKECTKRGLEKMEEAFHNLITFDDIAAFKNREDATAAVKLIGLAPAKIPRTRNEFTTVRNFILREIALANASRSGVLANMVMKEFKAACFVDDCYSLTSLSRHVLSKVYFWREARLAR